MALTLAGLCLLVGACESAPTLPLDGKFTVTEALLSDANVTANRVSYQSGTLPVRGIVCKPTASGQHPLLMLNHGGWAGLTTELDAATSVCVALARAGFVVIEPSYRGEDGSAGSIELCLGEASDIRAMLQIALADPSVDAANVGVIGGSHGGCSTLRAIIDGLPAVRVLSLAGPTDWAETYQNAVDSVAAGATGARRTFFEYVVSESRRYLGGTPAQVPGAYAARSIRARVDGIDRYAGTLLLQHGADDEVVPAKQACALAAQATGFVAYHVTAAGGVTTSPPPGCIGLGLTWSAGPVPATTGQRRVLIVYDALGHSGGANAALQNAHGMRFLFPGAN